MVDQLLDPMDAEGIHDYRTFHIALVAAGCSSLSTN
jgi:hypothetical protein